MNSKPLFIVIEGLDGSGKSTAAKVLAEALGKSFPKKIKHTYEPNDPCCAGGYIREVLAKKITAFHHRTLALAYAANRLDHCDRVVAPWLEKGRGHFVICDRYYLSSLVYQSRDGLSFADVMRLNELALRPDIIFFLNVGNEVCAQRIKKRNEPLELFEENLEGTRQMYFEAIRFLEKERGENIVEIDGNGTVEETVAQMLEALMKMGT
ncbi:MAG TPA: dTMP kinase [Bacteroidetes bacterium]|nr:dTMP kinase [Bacteroidota bacterium]